MSAADGRKIVLTRASDIRVEAESFDMPGYELRRVIDEVLEPYDWAILPDGRRTASVICMALQRHARERRK